MSQTNARLVLDFQREVLEERIETQESVLRRLNDRMNISRCDAENCIDYGAGKEGAAYKKELEADIAIAYEQYYSSYKAVDIRRVLQFLSFKQGRAAYLQSLLK